jgi:hypothetical protein
MSPEDQKVQKGEVLIEYQEVEDQIKALEVKAKRIGEAISTFGNWMQQSPVTHIYLHNQAHHGFSVEFLPDLIYRTMREWEQSFEVADKLRQANRRLLELK